MFPQEIPCDIFAIIKCGHAHTKELTRKTGGAQALLRATAQTLRINGIGLPGQDYTTMGIIRSS